MDRKQKRQDDTRAEIRGMARQLLTTGGASAISLNAIARQMGLSGPALYRYYPSHSELVAALLEALFEELIDAMARARDLVPATEPGTRLLALARGLRYWAIGHRAEFDLMFTSLMPDTPVRVSEARLAAGQAFEALFLEQVVRIWDKKRFPVPDLSVASPSLRKQLRAYWMVSGKKLSPEAMHVFLWCWSRLYGQICIEVFNQISFAYPEPEPVFEECLNEICEKLRIKYV